MSYDRPKKSMASWLFRRRWATAGIVLIGLLILLKGCGDEHDPRFIGRWTGTPHDPGFEQYVFAADGSGIGNFRSFGKSYPLRWRTKGDDYFEWEWEMTAPQRLGYWYGMAVAWWKGNKIVNPNRYQVLRVSPNRIAWKQIGSIGEPQQMLRLGYVPSR